MQDLHTVAGTSVGYVQHPYSYRDFPCVPYNIHNPTRNLCKFCTHVKQYPGCGYTFVHLPGTCVHLLLDFHTRTLMFCKFCEKSTPVPEIHKTVQK